MGTEMLRTLWNFGVIRLSFIGGIIDAIGRNVKADIRMSREKSNQWQTSREDHLRNVDWERQKEFRANEYQVQAADARAAGLHPLFAMGKGGAGFSPSTVASGARNYIAGNVDRASGNIGAAIDNYYLGKERKQRQSGMDARAQRMEQAQIRNLDSRSSLNEIEAMRRASDEAMNVRDVWDTGTGRGTAPVSDVEAVGVEGSEARTFPMGTTTRDPQLRPITQTANKSIPMRTEVIADDGYRYRIINPETGDEVSQADLIQQIILRHASKVRKMPARELKIWLGRMARAIRQKANPKAPKRKYRFGRRVQ